jgi:NAD(P) transhydrogenase subunit beta
MAVAQAQHAVKEMADILMDRGIEVKFGIHPVAGRMPGHMNVLLAEAEVPYEALCDMDEINPEFPQTDVVIVLGANDVVNPIARSEAGGALKGMPILDIDKARQTVIIKRSLSPGFAGVDNPQFYAQNNAMFFGDGKNCVNAIVASLKQE